MKKMSLKFMVLWWIIGCMYMYIVQYTKKAYLLIQQVSASKCIRIIACIGYWSNIHTMGVWVGNGIGITLQRLVSTYYSHT